MSTVTARYDAVVVGAGSTGAAAAWQLRRAGLSVALVERRPLDEAGARWVVDVPAWLFDRAGVPLPRPPESREEDPPLSLLGDGPGTGLRLSPNPTLAVDGPRLVARLQGLALEAGVEAFPRARLLDVECTRGRPRALNLRLPGPPHRLRLEAALLVDASGMAAALRCRVPELTRRCPPPRGAEVCSARRETYEVADPAGAESWLEPFGDSRDDVLCENGVSGPFSTRLVYVHPDRSRVEVLGGGSAGPDTGPEIVRRLVRRHAWIGPRVSGGGAPIPVRRPYDVLACPGLVLLGDAGCQVFPAHGSGVGAGLVAGRLLAEAVAGGGDPGAEAATWAYQAAFQTTRGAVHALYDGLRRLTLDLTEQQVVRLLSCGVITEGFARPGLEQRPFTPHPEELPRVARGAVRALRPAARAAGRLPRMLSAWLVYRRYPRRPDRLRLSAWARAAAAVTGHRRDPV